MFEIEDDDYTRYIGFVLVPNFSMIAFSSAIEPLRLADRTCDSAVFNCYTYSLDGQPVKASNGVTVDCDKALADASGLHGIFVCGGTDIHKYEDKALLSGLRRLASHGTDVGALYTGTHLLAKAGLLDGYKCTIHWENLVAFTEEFPNIEVTSELFEMDRSRATCAGGTAALDMMLNIVAREAGPQVAAEVADELIYHRIRDSHEKQRMELRSRLGVAHPKLLAVISCMEENLEEPLRCSDLASSVGLSARQLERLFRKYMNCAPTRYYLDLRLNRSRFLLRQTSLPILSVALASGFVSASHFSKCYREHFNCTPSEERRVTA